jgi:hypothetical protein
MRLFLRGRSKSEIARLFGLVQERITSLWGKPLVGANNTNKKDGGLSLLAILCYTKKTVV